MVTAWDVPSNPLSAAALDDFAPVERSCGGLSDFHRYAGRSRALTPGKVSCNNWKTAANGKRRSRSSRAGGCFPVYTSIAPGPPSSTRSPRSHRRLFLRSENATGKEEHRVLPDRCAR